MTIHGLANNKGIIFTAQTKGISVLKDHEEYLSHLYQEYGLRVERILSSINLMQISS